MVTQPSSVRDLARWVAGFPAGGFPMSYGSGPATGLLHRPDLTGG